MRGTSWEQILDLLLVNATLYWHGISHRNGKTALSIVAACSGHFTPRSHIFHRNHYKWASCSLIPSTTRLFVRHLILADNTEDIKATFCWHLLSPDSPHKIRFWAVRKITKCSSNFSVTNISSNIVWLLQLHDTIQMKSNYTWINYNHDNIAIRNHIMIYNCVWNLIFGTKFSSIFLAKREKRLVFRLSFVDLQRAKDGTHMFDAKYR